jgi:hypothetical protein
MPEQYAQFAPALAAGQQNEAVVAGEFEYRGVPLIEPPPGKHPFDRYLPDGRSIEIKLDLRSQRTANACIEFPTLQRGADIYIHTFTYARVYTHAEYQWLYNRGKIPASGGVGEYQYEGRYVSKVEMRAQGVFLDQFIKALKQ